LPDGWAEDLVKNGKLTVETKTMDTGQTVWSNASSAKTKYQNDHNNHVDIALDAAKLEK